MIIRIEARVAVPASNGRPLAHPRFVCPSKATSVSLPLTTSSLLYPHLQQNTKMNNPFHLKRTKPLPGSIIVGLSKGKRFLCVGC